MSYFDVDYDPVTKIKTVMHTDPSDSQYGIEIAQDVTDIIEANKILYNDVDERARWGNETYNRVASIPLGLFFNDLHPKFGADHKALLRWLDNPDNAAFRTRPGKLSR